MQLQVFFAIRGPSQMGPFREETVLKAPAGNFNPEVAGQME
jgi:hypothetical protein